MPKTIKYFTLSCLLSVLFITTNGLQAADLQIEDHEKLVRLLADVKGPQRLEVTLSQAAQSISMDNTDGVQNKKYADNTAANVYIFSGIEAGVWRLKVRPRDIVVLKVRILD